MIAVIQTGGKQYKIKENDILKIEKISGEVGQEINFDQIFLVASDDGNDVKIGDPVVAGAKVSAKILEHGRGKKLMVIKYKRKVRYRRKQGHRQSFTKIQIQSIA